MIPTRTWQPSQEGSIKKFQYVFFHDLAWVFPPNLNESWLNSMECFWFVNSYLHLCYNWCNIDSIFERKITVQKITKFLQIYRSAFIELFPAKQIEPNLIPLSLCYSNCHHSWSLPHPIAACDFTSTAKCCVFVVIILVPAKIETPTSSMASCITVQ